MEFMKVFFEKLSWVQQDYPVGSIHEVEHNGAKVKARVVRVYQPPLQTQFVSVPTVEFETVDGEENEAKADGYATNDLDGGCVCDRHLLRGPIFPLKSKQKEKAHPYRQTTPN